MADLQPLRRSATSPCRGAARGRDRASLRRDRCRAARRAGGAEPLQRRRDRPPAELRGRGRHARRLAPGRRARARGRARRLGAAPGLHGAGRQHPHAHRVLRARARGRVRGGPHPSARAHPPGAEGGPAQAHARDAREPVPHLQPLPRPRRRGHGDARQAGRGAVRLGDRPRRHAQHALALPTTRRSPSSRWRSPTRSC